MAPVGVRGPHLLPRHAEDVTVQDRARGEGREIGSRPGSEKPWHQMSSAARIAGEKRRRCASVPSLHDPGPRQHQADGVHAWRRAARTISSWKIICSTRLAPRPPYVRGRAMPTQPAPVEPLVPCEACVERPVGVKRELRRRWRASRRGAREARARASAADRRGNPRRPPRTRSPSSGGVVAHADRAVKDAGVRATAGLPRRARPTNGCPDRRTGLRSACAGVLRGPRDSRPAAPGASRRALDQCRHVRHRSSGWPAREVDCAARGLAGHAGRRRRVRIQSVRHLAGSGVAGSRGAREGASHGGARGGVCSLSGRGQDRLRPGSHRRAHGVAGNPRAAREPRLSRPAAESPRGRHQHALGLGLLEKRRHRKRRRPRCRRGGGAHRLGMARHRRRAHRREGRFLLGRSDHSRSPAGQSVPVT